MDEMVIYQISIPHYPNIRHFSGNVEYIFCIYPFELNKAINRAVSRQILGNQKYWSNEKLNSGLE